MNLVSVEVMLDEKPLVAMTLDQALIGYLTAVTPESQPQTAPVWYIREKDDLIVYNKRDTPRLASIDANPRVAFNLRADRQGIGAVLLEGVAARDPDLGPSHEIPEYVDKYQGEMERIGWTPQTFHDDYPVPVRITVTRLRAWGLQVFEDADNR